MTVDRHAAPINLALCDGEPVLVGVWPDITRFAAGFFEMADPKWVTVEEERGEITVRTKTTTAIYRKVHSTDRGDWVCRKVSAT